MPKLNLLVLRASDPEKLAAFYALLGLAFAKHRHGSGPEHFATEDAGAIFEIYPLKVGQAGTSATRLGFEVADAHAAVAVLSANGAKVLQEPFDSEWGIRAVIQDPEGHKVELLSKQPSSA